MRNRRIRPTRWNGVALTAAAALSALLTGASGQADGTTKLRAVLLSPEQVTSEELRVP